MRAALLLTALAVAAVPDSFDAKIEELAGLYDYEGVRELEPQLLKHLQDEKDGRHGHDYNQKAFFKTIADSTDEWTLYARVKGTESIEGKPPESPCTFSIELQASEKFSTEGLFRKDNVDALKRPFPQLIVAVASVGVNKECGGDLPPEFTEFGQASQIVSYVHTTLGLHSSNLFGSLQVELVAVSQSNPRKILFAHRQGPTGFSFLFDKYKAEGEDAFVAYLESEARPVEDEPCVKKYLDALDEYRRGLTDAQRAQEEEAASKAVEMEERTRVGIENGGPVAGWTIVLETGYRDVSPDAMHGAGEFAGRDDIVDYFDPDGEVLLYGNPARMKLLHLYLRKETEDRTDRDEPCIDAIESKIGELGDETIDRLEIILRDLGADVIRMDSPDATLRLRDALGTHYSVDLGEKRFVLIVADHLVRQGRPTERLAQFSAKGRAFGESWFPALAATGFDFDSVDEEAHTVYRPGTYTVRDTFPDGTRFDAAAGRLILDETNVPDARDDEDLPDCTWPDPVPPPLKDAGFDSSDIDMITRDRDRMVALRAVYRAKFDNKNPPHTLQTGRRTWYQTHYPQYTQQKEGLLRDCLRSGYENVGRNDVPGYGTAFIPFPLVPPRGQEHLHGHLPRFAPPPADESESESGEADDHEEF